MDIAAKQLAQFWNNLIQLGARRLLALGLIGIIVFLSIGISAWFLTRPNFEVLYKGLDKQDTSQIGAALREANIAFDVTSEGGTVLVAFGKTAQARMLLAEKGLPSSSAAGYELFDKLGSLGLTSFMQEVTRVRAVEGELARTIQLIKGIKSVRVHIVAGDDGSFRRSRQTPSAAVILRTDQPDGAIPVAAIRHLVSAAVPGLKPDQVTIVGSDGALLTSNDDSGEAAPTRLRSLERNISQEIQDNIRKTLASYLSLRNFQISVTARINTDKREVSETIFNPESRVERSVRVVRENQTAQNSSQSPPTSVERNLPQDPAKQTQGKSSNEENQKREETTNYELSSKRITTSSAGYTIDNLSIAVLLNQTAVLASLGDRATPEAIAARLSEIEALVSSAAGLRRDRGDTIKISALVFSDAMREFEPAASLSIVEALKGHAGTLINVAASVVIVTLLIFLGLRPLARTLVGPEPRIVDGSTPVLITDGTSSKATPELAMQTNAGLSLAQPVSLDSEELLANPLSAAQEMLGQLVDLDEERAVAIMKQWIREAA